MTRKEQAEARLRSMALRLARQEQVRRWKKAAKWALVVLACAGAFAVGRWAL
jgi:hypothetical protein